MQYPLVCTSTPDCPPNHACNNGECKFSTIHGISIHNITPTVIGGAKYDSSLFVGIGGTQYFAGEPDHGAPTIPIYEKESFSNKAGATSVSKLINYVSILDNYVAVTLYPKEDSRPWCSIWAKLGSTVLVDLFDLVVYLKYPDGTTTRVHCG
jgi:hypothetical protein